MRVAILAAALACGPLTSLPCKAQIPQPVPDSIAQRFTAANIMIDGQRIHYVRGGRGQPVVLLHGFPQTWTEYAAVMPLLADAGFEVIAIDLPGIGGSTNPSGNYSKKALAGDVHRFVQALKLRRPHIVGHDIGAMVGYSYAAQFPQDLRTLTYMDAPLPGTPAFDQTAQDPRAWHFSFNAAEDIPEALVSGREDVYYGAFFAKLAGSRPAPSAAEIQSYVETYSQRPTMKAGFGFYRAFQQDRLDNEAFMRSPINTPVLTLSAGGLVPTPYITEMFRPLANDVSGGAVPGVGHWMNEEQPQEIAQRLITHFRRYR